MITIRVLAVDSSSVSASVAILDGSKILTELYINAGLTHSQTLAPMIDFAVKSCNLDLKDMDFFAVTNGPGSFTGIRIAVATIKGMAIGLNKKCAGISSLLAASYPSKDFDGLVCACMDARRGEIYNSIYDFREKEIIKVKEERAISIKDLAKEIFELKSKVKLVGDGAEMCYNSLSEMGINNISLSMEHERFVNASSIAKIAVNLPKECLLDSKDLNPKYLRVSQAERLLKEKKF